MRFIISYVISLFGYNIDPMRPVKNDIQTFKTHFPQHIKTSYAEAGDSKNRPVIFVHGSPGSKEGWYSFLLDKNLLEKFHLITVDRPGYGTYDKGLTEISVKSQAQAIWQVLAINQSGLSPILVGHSYGGAVIAKMAMLHPDKVYGLMFVASSVDPKLEEVKPIQKIGNLWGIRSLIPKNLRVCNEEILALKAELIKMLPDWSVIKSKIVIIHGDQDDLVPVENVQFIKSQMTPDKIYVLRGMNHFIPWHKPEVIISALIEWEGQ